MLFTTMFSDKRDVSLCVDSRVFKDEKYFQLTNYRLFVIFFFLLAHLSHCPIPAILITKHQWQLWALSKNWETKPTKL